MYVYRKGCTRKYRLESRLYGTVDGSTNGSWDVSGIPADFAGADDMITNLAKSLDLGSSNALPNLLLLLVMHVV